MQIFIDFPYFSTWILEDSDPRSTYDHAMTRGLYTHEVNEALELVARAVEMLEIPEVVAGSKDGKNLANSWVKSGIIWNYSGIWDG